MICGTQISIPGLLDGDHHNGPVNICDAGVHVRDYKQKQMRPYEPPAPLLKVGTVPFNGHNQRGMPIERPSLGEVDSVPRLMKDTDKESGVYVTKKMSVTPGKPLPSGPGSLP